MARIGIIHLRRAVTAFRMLLMQGFITAGDRWLRLDFCFANFWQLCTRFQLSQMMNKL